MFNHVSRRALFAVQLFLLLSLPFAAWPQVFQGVLTGQFSVSRTGANTQETTLTPSNVSGASFGFLFAHTVDATVYAQPLYVPRLTINGALHNLVIVATLNNSVYAFDADTSQTQLWHTTLGLPVTLGGMKIGILGTPAVDPALNSIFVVALSAEGDTPVYTLYALNLLTGEPTARVDIQAAVPGTGDNSRITPCLAASGATIPPLCVPFVASQQLQRPALLEEPTHQNIYLAFGTLNGNEATAPYHGWLLGYHFLGSGFAQIMAFNTTQNASQTGQACSTLTPPRNQCGHGGGIWMSGRGPALDSTGVYVVSGNGGFGGPGTGNWSESALRLTNVGTVADFFTPANYASLNVNDLDLGDAGAILFASTNTAVPNLMLVAGKSGRVSVLNREDLGGLTANNSGAVQTFTGTRDCGQGPGRQGCFEIHSMAMWPRTNSSPLLYFWAHGDVPRVWDFDGTANQFTPDAHQGAIIEPNYPGAGLSLSANGNTSGILWAIVPFRALGPGMQGALYAFDATNVTTPIWTSNDFWFASKFNTPTIAGGKVFVATSGSPDGITPVSFPQIRIYGLGAP